MAVGCTVGAGVGLGGVVAIGTAVAAGTGVGARVALDDRGGGVLVGALVAFWPDGVDPGVIDTGAVGATVSAGARGLSAGGGVPQADTSKNIPAKTMIEPARFMRVTVPSVS